MTSVAWGCFTDVSFQPVRIRLPVEGPRKVYLLAEWFRNQSPVALVKLTRVRIMSLSKQMPGPRPQRSGMEPENGRFYQVPGSRPTLEVVLLHRINFRRASCFRRCRLCLRWWESWQDIDAVIGYFPQRNCSLCSYPGQALSVGSDGWEIQAFPCRPKRSHFSRGWGWLHEHAWGVCVSI